MENPYLRFSYEMLKSFEKMYRQDMKDSTITSRKQSNAEAKLKLVREAMKIK